MIVAAFNADKRNPERPNLYPERGSDSFYYRCQFTRREADLQFRKMRAAAVTDEERASVARFSIWPLRDAAAIGRASCDPFRQAVKRGTY